MVRIFALVFVGAAAATATIPATVDLGYSTIRGQSLAAGVNQYLGVRYAAPPVGELRFRAPADPVKTEEVQEASSVSALS
jgi:acetylcholinesterase